MEKVLLVIHGSPKKEANNWEPFLKLLSASLRMSEEDLSLAYLQFGKPTLEEALSQLCKERPKRIFVHPFFLSAGQHVTKDIPEILERFRKEYPETEILYTAPLGLHEKLAEIVVERLKECGVRSAKEIEEKSFEIIEREIDLSPFTPEERLIIKRVIHATADPEYRYTLTFHPQAISLALYLLREGKSILTDVEMVRAGINKRYGKNRVLCYLSEVEDPGEGTRAEKAIELALAQEKDIGLIAIGNAPTALLKAIELLEEYKNPLVVIGMPVGFVKALEAKLLLTTKNIPYITNLSRKGGTPACVAVVNALLKLAHEGTS